VIARLAFLEGGDRYHELFKPNPPTYVLQFSERVVMLKGRLVQSHKPDPSEDNPMRKAASATAYCALIYIKAAPQGRTLLDWIEPCRTDFEMPGDYPEESDGLARLYERARGW
jgi:hypothetical protein